MVDRPDYNYYRQEVKMDAFMEWAKIAEKARGPKQDCKSVYVDGEIKATCHLEAGHPGPHVHHYAMSDWSWWDKK